MSFDEIRTSSPEIFDDALRKAKPCIADDALRHPIRAAEAGDTGRGDRAAFTAVGEVLSGEPYPADGPGGRRFYRCTIRYDAIQDVPIRPLLPELSFSGVGGSWGRALRRGTLRITGDDYALIARAGAFEAIDPRL